MSADPDFRIAAATDQPDVGPSELHATLALIERAKGALMLRYGVDSHQAFALLGGICEGNPQIEIRQRALLRWLESQ